MRLIDAELLLSTMEKRYKEKVNIVPDNLAEGFTQMEKLIKEQPTAYDVDKVVEQLESEIDYSDADFEQYAELHDIDTEDDWFYAGLKRAIEIVKAGGIGE